MNGTVDPALLGGLWRTHETGVRVCAPGRLHLGFLDPAATLGRRFGSLGLVIDGFETIVELRPAKRDAHSGADAAAVAELPRALAHLEALRTATGRREPVHLHLAATLPAHAGLGSGTQLALAVGRAFASLWQLPLTSLDTARITGRGLRSGVGIAGFDQGGLLLDGGPAPDGRVAPLLARVELPDTWAVLLALDPRLPGLSGAEEKAALARLTPLPREHSAQICHEVLMRVLPGAAEADFAPFAAGIGQVQRLLGAHFAPAQHGRAYASAAVGRLFDGIAARGGAAVGQSSWGPTGFALLPCASAADDAIATARAHDQLDPELQLHVVRPRNHGAVVTPCDGPAPT